MNKLFFLLGFFLLPVLGRGQVDTVRVVAEVDSLISMANDLLNLGKPKDAIPYAKEAKKQTKACLGEENKKYVTTLSLLGRCYYYMRKFNQVEQYFVEVKKIQEILNGKHHPEYAKILANLASLYVRLDRYDEAGLLYNEATPLFEELFGKNHIVFASYLNGLGNFYSAIENYELAEKKYLESKRIAEELNGRNNNFYIHALANLASVYERLGRYKDAEDCYLETAELFETNQGTNTPDYATVLHNIALLYKIMGRYDEAKSLHIKAKEIVSLTLGTDNLDYAKSLNYVGVILQYMENYQDAEPLFIEASKIFKEVLGRQSRDFAECLINIAICNVYDKDLIRAETLFLEAAEIQKYLNKNYDYAYSMFNLGSLSRMTGDYIKGKYYFSESKKLRKELFGRKHAEFAASTGQLGFLYIFSGDYEVAKQELLETFDVQKQLISNALFYLSEQELASYMKTFLGYFYTSLSLVQNNQLVQEKICPINYNNTIFHKGFLLNASNRLKNLALSDSVTTEKFNDLKSYRYLLSKEYAKPIAERQHVEEWEEKANTIEKDLTRTVAGFGEAMKQVTWEEVRDRLQPGEVAVEFVHYRYHDPEPADSLFYSALVLRPGDTAPHFVTLFEEKEIAPLLSKASGERRRSINDFYNYSEKAKGEQLYQFIWQPLEELLEGADKVYCSPSGLLHRINLGAVPLDENEVFSDRHQLIQLISTRQLVVPDKNTLANKNAHIFGGIRYSTDSTAMTATKIAGYNSRSRSLPNALKFQADTSDIRSNTPVYLPHSLKEALDIQETLESAGYYVQLDTGYVATEEAFRQIGVNSPAPRILHISTHGYFYPDPDESPQNKNKTTFQQSSHPMIRSGLLMANSADTFEKGESPHGREDGVLTAYEISQQNLSGTELAVLSACETGLGEIKGNEGVYGLQRAFKIAGSKYLIMSLWKVNDNSTQKFMTTFYSYWLDKGFPIPDAFRKAQMDMRSKYPNEPYHWAGFVLVE